MNAEILAVGTELLLGDIANTNAQFLSKELSALGIDVFFHSVVGDNQNRLKSALELAFSRSDIVITTGGLGPTYDDLTKETASELLGAKLILNEEALKRIKAFFERIGRQMVVSNEKQALLPTGCVPFQNDCGTAPGFGLKKDGKVLMMLPGPPREMTEMFSKSAKPFLAELSDSVMLSKEIRVFGIGESSCEEKIKDLTECKNPTLAPYAKSGEVLLRITAKANSLEEAENLIKPMADEVISRLKPYIYGVNVSSLQEVLVHLLLEKGKKIAVAESCTGGLLAKRITEISGASQVFECGIVAYANHIKEQILGVKSETLSQFGAVSEQTAIEMALGVKKLANSHFGVGITGIAGPNGGTEEKPVGLVFVAVVDEQNRPTVRRLMLGRGQNEREYVRYAAASNAMDMVIKLIRDKG